MSLTLHFLMQEQMIKGIKVIKTSTPDQVAANIFAEQIKKNPNIVLGLATGSTPVEMYKELIKMNLDWKNVTTFNLDEYKGIKQNNKQSYYTFMHENLFNHVSINENNVNFLNSEAQDVQKEIERYENKIKEHPIDIQLLGIGSNGHIAFNEPGSSEDSITREVNLTQQTIKDNSRFFSKDEFQPTSALSMGIKTIMQAKQIVLIAKGKGKQNAIRAALGQISTNCPASFLQKHGNTIFIISDDIDLE